MSNLIHVFRNLQQVPIIRTLIRLARNTSRKNISLVAGGVAFYAFLSVFPAIAFALMLWGLVTDSSELTELFVMMKGVLPDPVYTIMSQQMTRIISADGPSSPYAAITALAIAFWASTRAINAILRATQSIYHTEIKRNHLAHWGLTFGFTLAGVVFALLSLVMIAAVPPLLDLLRLDSFANTILRIMRWVVITLAFALAGSALYTVARRNPKRKPARGPARIWPGALASSAIWLLASLAFSTYLSSFANFNKTFGSLGAVVALLMWFWVSAFAILFGAEVNTDYDGKEARRRDRIVEG